MKSLIDAIPGCHELICSLTMDGLSQREIAKRASGVFRKKITRGIVDKRQRRMGLNKSAPFVGVAKTFDDLVKNEKDKQARIAEQKETMDLIRKKAKTEMVIDHIMPFVKPITFPDNEFVKKLIKVKHINDEEHVGLLLSDMHIGKITKSYNPMAFKRKLDKLFDGLMNLIEKMRLVYPLKTLHIIGLGDWVDGINIYPTQNWHVENPMKQIFQIGAPAIAAFIYGCSKNFDNVELHCVMGNHGRSGKFNPEDLNFDIVLYEYLKALCVNMPNVKFDIGWDWYKVIDINGHNFLLTHGNVINTWLNIPIYGQIQKGMRWQGSIPEKWEYLCLGHFHCTLKFRWNNFRVINNGTFTSDDDFVIQKLGLQSTIAQFLFGVHKKRGVTWNFEIEMD